MLHFYLNPLYPSVIYCLKIGLVKRKVQCELQAQSLKCLENFPLPSYVTCIAQTLAWKCYLFGNFCISRELFCKSEDVQLKDGDTIRIDAETRSLDVTNVDDAEWASRREAWQEPPLKYSSGVLYKYIKNVTSASVGCVTDS